MATYLLLHAFPFDGSMWDEVARRLRASGHVVMAPDLRGFGAAPLGDVPADLEHMVDDVLALLEEPAYVVGCSMGGYVALGVARRRPELVQGLALVDTKATADGEAARGHRERVAALAESEGDWGAGMIEGLLGESARRTRPELVGRVRGVLSAASGKTIAWAQRAMAARPDATDVLRDLNVPVLVVMGEEDTMSPLSEQEIILAASRHAHLLTIPACGHLSPLESPDKVASALLGLLPGSEC